MEEKEILQPAEGEKVTGTPTSTLPPKITKETLDVIEGTKRQQTIRWVKSILLTLLSSLLVSFAVYSFITPNGFTIGGIAGIAILAHVASSGKLAESTIVLCINAPLIVLAFFFVKKRFAILSTLNILLQSLFLFLLEQLFEKDAQIVFPGEETSKIFAAIAAGLLIGVAIVCAFKAGGSSGGADILAVMIQKKISAGSIAWILFVMNCIVIGSSIFFLRPEGFNDLPQTEKLGTLLLPIALSAFESYIESKTIEAISNGFQSAIEFRIITDKHEEMATALMNELSRGVTAIPATGMYTNITHTMLFCVVSRRQAPTVQRIMKSIDPDSFAVTSKVSQVLGLGFYRSEL